MWNAGHRDRNAANFGHATFRYSRGLLYGIVGASPLAVISIGFVLSKFGLLFNFVLPYKMLINPEIWPIINMLEPTVFLPNFAVWEVLLIAFLSVAVPVLIGEFGYFMGARDISIVQKLVYKDNKKKER